MELYRVAGEVGSFVGCLMSQDVSDTQAKLIAGHLSQLGASFAGIEIALRERIRQVPDETWSHLLADPRIQPIAFQLQEIREDVDEMLSPDQETLIADLSVDGLHAWGRFYNTLVGRVLIPVDIDGEVKLLSAGQAYNKFDNQDQAYRANLMTNWEASWGKDAELFATALNHIGGSRLTNYRHHKWESVLARP